ncbi:hypothetical protein [Hyalangium versicolor]|uniref:hypothetical protein n=1 Tax=Hyalangium versicolor TaxID=2861190 RepID=UPI001CD0022E|nr:hypothetical protein [Hyalangium versicolor]
MPTLSSRALLLSLVLGLSLCTACSEDLEPDDPGRRDLLFTFDGSLQGWTGGFTDLAPGQEDQVAFTFEQRELPTETGIMGGALLLSGRNVSDDLFMFVTHPVNDLSPDSPYSLTFELELASDASTGCAGIGGAPGESVFLKVGAAAVEPARVTDESGHYRINVDKGNQSGGGANAQVVGNIANGSTDCTHPTYRRITRDNRANPFRINSDGEGRLWLLLGTDSGFEGTTALYVDTIRVVLEPIAQ